MADSLLRPQGARQRWMRNFVIFGGTLALLALLLPGPVVAHGPGGNGQKATVPLRANPNLPEFAGAGGSARLDLPRGTVQLLNLAGFPRNPESGHLLAVTLTHQGDPRFPDGSGDLLPTSCRDPEGDGTWVCHVHGYVAWLTEIAEDGALHHPLPLGVIYPQVDGKAANRSFNAQGDLEGFGYNAVIITAEPSMVLQPYLDTRNPDQPTLRLLPQGPVVLRGDLPSHE